MMYPVPQTDPATAIKLLEEVVPGMRLSGDARSGLILAWGQQSEHELLAKTLKDMQTPQADFKPRLVVYPLASGDATVLATMLRTLVPQAVVAVDAKTGGLAATATPLEHELIRSAIEQMSKGGPPETQPKMVVYTLESIGQSAVAGATATLGTVFPNAKILAGAEPGTLVVWARPAEHVEIAKAVAELGKKESSENAHKFVVYTVESSGAVSVASALPILRVVFPDAHFGPGAEPGKLIAWARPADHKRIQETIDQMWTKEPAEKARTLVVYTVEGSSPYAATGAITALTPMFPDAHIAAGNEPDKIIVWARPADHKAIQAAIKQIATKESAETVRRAVVYTIESSSPNGVASAISVLTTIYPTARITTGTKPGTLVVYARPAEHEQVKKTIDQLAQKDPPEKVRTLAVHTVEVSSPYGVSGVIATLTQEFPDAQIAAGNEPDKIIVWARPADHQAIRAAIKEVGGPESAETVRKAVVYNTGSANPTNTSLAMTLLSTIHPTARIALGTEPGTLVVYARPTEHEKIKKTIDQLAQKDPPERARTLVVHTVDGSSPYGVTGVIATLTQEFPDAHIGAGSEPGQVIVWARPADHKAIEAAFAKLTKKESAKTARWTVVYNIGSASPGGASAAITLLSTIYPTARVSLGTEPGTLVVYARPAEHREIKRTIDQLAQKDPPDKARTLAVHTVDGTSPYGVTGVIATLTQEFPDAHIGAGSEPGQVIVWARPADHKAIQAAIELLKKEPVETARTTVIYNTGSASPGGASAALTLLSTIYPTARVAPGTEAGTLMVYARPAEHREIKKTIDQLAQKDPPDKARTLAVHTVDGTSPYGVTGVIATLTQEFPDAHIGAGSEPGQVLVWARPADHKPIQEAIERLKKEPVETVRSTVIYSVESTTPNGVASAVSLLTTIYPTAKFAPGTEPGKLAAYARPAEHKEIKKTLDQLVRRDPPEIARRIAVYTLESAGKTGVTGAITALTPMFPDAKFSAGTEPGKLVAWVRPVDQKEIKAAVDEMLKKESPETAHRMETYQLESISTAAALPILREAFPDAELAAGADPGKLVAWARPKDHEALKLAVLQMGKKGPPETAPKAAVYDVEGIGAAAAMEVLTSAFPDAKLSQGTDPHKLVVVARAEDQERIKTMIEGVKGRESRLAVHRITSADPANVLAVLQGLFRTRPNVQLSLDEKNDTIVAVASPSEQETIRALVAQVEKGAAADSAARLQTYPMEDYDAEAVMTVLGKLLEKRGPKAQLSHDPRTNQLVAVARTDQHAVIEATLKQMRGEKRKLEILQLENLEPFTAEMAVNRMFSEGTYSSMASAPMVDIDETTQQLFVRGTEKQLTEIRQLLIRMGETHLVQPTAADTRRTRVIRFDGDTGGAIEEIQRVWPQLRTNPIHVMKRSTEIPVQGRPLEREKESLHNDWRKPEPAKKAPSGRATINEAAADGPQVHTNRSMTDPPGPPEKSAVSAAAGNPPSPDRKGWSPGFSRSDKEKPPEGGTPTDRKMSQSPAAAAAPAQPKGTSAGPDSGKPAASAKEEKPATDKPILVIPGDGEVTISSDDPAALAQFEELLRALTHEKGAVGRNYSIFLLRNAKATEIAPTLQRLFRAMPNAGRGAAGARCLSPMTGSTRWSPMRAGPTARRSRRS